MSHFHPTQDGGDSDFQMWRQQMMYKQLQELQRQQQLQQLDHGARMQASFGQYHSPAKPAHADQLPTVLNEMPTNEASSYAWSNNLVSGDPRLASNSQIFNTGNSTWEQFGGSPSTNNFANGSMYSNNQSQSLRPMGLAAQQVDHSFYPMPASSNRGSDNQYSQFLGISGDSQNAMGRVAAEQLEKASRLPNPFNSFQNKHAFREQGASNPILDFRGKGGLLSNAQAQNQGDNIKAGSPHAMNHLQHGFQVQDFHGRPNQGDFEGSLQEKSTGQAGPTSGGASLDPTEEKILFGSDEDSNWGALLRGSSLSGGPNDHANSLDNDNFGGPFPSLQSGSWSALMQEALQSTSSENGLQEEWSGLTLQKTDQLIANNSTLPGEDARKLTALNDANLQRAPSLASRPSPLRNDADRTMNATSPASFQHPRRTPYEQRDKMSHESSNATVTNHQSNPEAHNRYLEQSLKQKQSDEYCGQELMNLTNGVWSQQKSELPKSISHTGTHVMSKNTHGHWISQQNTFNHNFSNESGSKPNDWNSNSPLGQGINNSSNVFHSDGNLWKSGGGNANSVGRLEQLKPEMNTLRMQNDSSAGKGVGMMNLNTASMNQDQYHMVIGRSDENLGMNHNMGQRVSGTSESPGNNAERRSDDFNQEYINVASNESQGHVLNHGQHVSIGFTARTAQNSSQSGQQTTGSYMLQNHLARSSGMNIGHYPPNQVSRTQFLPQSRESPSNLEFGGRSQIAGHEKLPMGEEELKAQHASPNNDSIGLPFGGSDGVFSQNRNVQTSQNMLQLLHKVDNSKSGNAVTAGNVTSRTVDGATAHQPVYQPSLQGFGLRLAPPSQRQPSPGHLMSSRASLDSKQHDHSSREEDQTQLPSTSGQSMQSGHPSSQSSPFHMSGVDNTGQLNGGFPQMRSSSQQYALESRSGSVPCLPQQPQQGGSPTMFKNVWTNISAQRLAGIQQQNKITPNILQSMMFRNSAGDANLWGSQKTDDQGQKAETPSDAATSSANSQNQEAKQVVESGANLTSSEMVHDSMAEIVSRGKESLQKHLDGSTAGPASSLPQLHQQGMSMKQGENPAANFQAINASLSNASSGSGIGLHGSPAPSNVQHQNYSLLHQIQAMKHSDFDPSDTFGKRLKTTDVGSDASPVDWKAGQGFAYGANNSIRSSTDNRGGLGVQSSFPSDVKMLSFASRNNEERSPSIPSQLPSRELPPNEVTAQHDLQSHLPSLGTSSASNLIERSERPRISPQMAPSWFEQYGSQRNGQTVAMYNAQKTPTPFNFPRVSRSMDSASVVEQRIDSGQSDRSGHYMSSAKLELHTPSDIKASSMVRRPKKRKCTASALVSWHKIIGEPQKLRTMSMAEIDWARAANRLIEKVEDEAEILEDAPVTYLPRRRLILTTQLIQQILPAIPATILKAQAVAAYESATYTVAKLTLGDACSMALSSSGKSRTSMDNANDPPEETKGAEKAVDKFSKAVEVYIGRFKEMECDFLRLNKRTSMLDVQLECQELERFSIVNRLGKFHGRNHGEGVEGSSTSEIGPRRVFPQRHVTSFAVSGNLPEGVFCLSL